MSTKPSLSINLGLPAVPEVDSAELYGALTGVYNAIKNVMYAVDAYTGNTLITESEYSEVNPYALLTTVKTSVLFLKITEDINAGHLVNIYDSGGARGRKALGGSYLVHAFALASGKTGDTIPVALGGLCSLIGGLTPGTYYYLSGTAGQLTTASTYQRVGFAVGPNHLWFSPA